LKIARVHPVTVSSLHAAGWSLVRTITGEEKQKTSFSQKKGKDCQETRQLDV
jgi:phosphoribosylaminoimidazole (AIR) synthetase